MTNRYSKQQDYTDKINSRLSVGIHHVDYWWNPKMEMWTNHSTCYLKNINSPEHDRASETEKFLIELDQSLIILENKVTNRNSRNRMTCLKLWSNHKKGGTITNTVNVPYCQLVIKMGRIPFTGKINPDYLQDPVMAATLNELMDAWIAILEKHRYQQQFL
jgi:hypothetical protein